MSILMEMKDTRFLAFTYLTENPKRSALQFEEDEFVKRIYV